MPATGNTVLIVDDDPCVRELLSYVLTKSGYRVRTAEDGFTALVEIRKDVPDILLSDLIMPGMSGFELLTEVRRRFPTIRTVAMSSLFSTDDVPSSVIADAFFQKGSAEGLLVEVMRALPCRQGTGATNRPDRKPTPIRGECQDNPIESDGMISCPECLRTFAPIYGEAIFQMQEISCAHCRGLIQSGATPTANQGLLLVDQEDPEFPSSPQHDTQSSDN